MRRLLGGALVGALAIVGLAACSSPPPCHRHGHCRPLESGYICPVDGSIGDKPGLCAHCGSVRVQKSTDTQTWTENSYSVK